MTLNCFISPNLNNFLKISNPRSINLSSNIASKNFKSFFLEEKILIYKPLKNKYKKSHKNWCAVFGPGGGFFGVGTSELIVIGIVAWLVLGPKRLYQLARDIGKISGEIKNVAEEAKQTFQQAIDLENLNNENFDDRKKTTISGSNKDEINFVPNTTKKSSIKELDELIKTDLTSIEKKKID
jgi:Tat protein translocase TatB subunit